MWRSFMLALSGWLAWACLACAQGRPPDPPADGAGAAPQAPAATPAAAEEVQRLLGLQNELQRNAVALGELKGQQAATQESKDVERLQKQIELLQKQIEILQKTIQVLAEQLRQQKPAGDAEQAAVLEARSRQAARRDRELAGAVDDLREEVDVDRRWGPRLPATLKELFLPSETSESPLSIYGQFITGFHGFNGRPPQFEMAEFSPYFLLVLNERFVLEANVDLSREGVDLPTAQLDWLVSDWLTVVGGRCITPIGFFNERLNHEWINKLPDVPLMFRQVSPLSSTDGLQARGAFYVGCTPVKIEYSVYGGNGFQFPEAATDLTTISNLEALTDGPDEVDAKAVGGRLGFWLPEWGVAAGASGYFQDRYLPGSFNNIRLWGLDANYHHGNWDVRFEFAQMFQQAEPITGDDIRRTGMYAQVAYRDYDHPCKFVRNLELVARYSAARFKGIDVTLLDPAAFDTPVDVPINRDQYTVGVNYYFYPSMVLKFAHEINHELGPLNFSDNVFLSQFAWSF